MEFNSFNDGDTILYKTTKPIDRKTLKIPTLYLFKEASRVSGSPVKDLKLTVSLYGPDAVVLSITNADSFCFLKEFSYRDVASLQKPIRGYQHQTNVDDSDSDDEYDSGIETAIAGETRERREDSYTIKETVLINYRNDFILVVGSTKVSGSWYYFIRSYRFLKFFLWFILFKLTSVIAILASAYYVGIFMIAIYFRDKRTLSLLKNQFGGYLVLIMSNWTNFFFAENG